jgi:hypothetical protein
MPYLEQSTYRGIDLAKDSLGNHLLYTESKAIKKLTTTTKTSWHNLGTCHGYSKENIPGRITPHSGLRYDCPGYSLKN